VLASRTFPVAQRAKRRATNPLERLTCGIKRRSAVVGSLPDEAAIPRLVGTIPLAQSDDGAVQRARDTTLEAIAPVPDDPIIGVQ
jgi:transposase-like protein